MRACNNASCIFPEVCLSVNIQELKTNMTELQDTNSSEKEENRVGTIHSLRDNIEELLAGEIQKKCSRSRRKDGETISSEQRRTSPFIFPTLGNLPGLLFSTVDSVLHNAQLEFLRSQGENYDDLNPFENLNPEEMSTSEGTEETWSQFLLHWGEFRQRPTHIHRTYPRGIFRLPVQMGARALPSTSTSTVSRLTDETTFLEKQVITTELDAFITSLQQDRKDFDKYDADESIKSEQRRVSTTIKVTITLFLLILIVFGNIGAAIFLFYEHFKEGEEEVS